MHLNVEIKARCLHPEKIRKILEAHQARFIGLDRQVDTYFNVPHGRLKLREGNIENALIHYQRNDQAGPKNSEVQLYRPGPHLKSILGAALGVRVVVDKKREIYFIENVKFHLDEVPPLGAFVEIEAIDEDGSIGEARLKEQCTFYLELFEVKKEDLVEVSYSDLLCSSPAVCSPAVRQSFSPAVFQSFSPAVRQSSGCRTEDCRTAGLMDCRTAGLPD